MPHDFMTLHAAKAVEYLLALGYLLLFIPFWRFVNPKMAGVREHAAASRTVPASGSGFAQPEGLFFHPGHAWLRLDSADTVTVGLTDFAARLVGTPSAVTLPQVGTAVVQGEPAWALVADNSSIAMLSPVDGTVTAVNEDVLRTPGLAHDNPYGDGWLLKVRNPRLASNLKQLLNGQLAKRWMQDVAASLWTDFTPALGHVYEDGGTLVDGVARAIDPDAWDAIARRHFLTDGAALPREGGNHA